MANNVIDIAKEIKAAKEDARTKKQRETVDRLIARAVNSNPDCKKLDEEKRQILIKELQSDDQVRASIWYSYTSIKREYGPRFGFFKGTRSQRAGNIMLFSLLGAIGGMVTVAWQHLDLLTEAAQKIFLERMIAGAVLGGSVMDIIKNIRETGRAIKAAFVTGPRIKETCADKISYEISRLASLPKPVATAAHLTSMSPATDFGKAVNDTAPPTPSASNPQSGISIRALPDNFTDHLS